MEQFLNKTISGLTLAAYKSEKGYKSVHGDMEFDEFPKEISLCGHTFVLESIDDCNGDGTFFNAEYC